MPASILACPLEVFRFMLEAEEPEDTVSTVTSSSPPSAPTPTPVLGLKDLYSLMLVCRRLADFTISTLYRRNRDHHNSHAAEWAAENGSVAALEIALSFGLNVHKAAGRTTLHAAAEAGHGAVVTWLLDHGAKINRNAYFSHRHTSGPTFHPYWYDDMPRADVVQALAALAANDKELAHFMLNLLLDLGADVNGPDPEWRNSHLSASLRTGQTQMAFMFLEAGARADNDYIPRNATRPWRACPVADYFRGYEGYKPMGSQILQGLIERGADMYGDLKFLEVAWVRDRMSVEGLRVLHGAGLGRREPGRCRNPFCEASA